MSDLLCRMRGMGYDYYECQRVDLAHNPAGNMLQKEHCDPDSLDLERLTFELDENVAEVTSLVATIFGRAKAALQ